jgi:hypothetical protein
MDEAITIASRLTKNCHLLWRWRATGRPHWRAIGCPMPSSRQPADRGAIRQRLVGGISSPATLDDIAAGGGGTLRPTIDELRSLVALLMALLQSAWQPRSPRRYLDSLAYRIEAETVALARSMPR